MFAYCANCPSATIDSSGCLPTSVFGDLPYPGFAHALVQKQIVDRSGNTIAMEVAVRKTDGSLGRVDLLNRKTGEMWEVKHVSSVAIGNATNQLNGYLSGTTYPPIGKQLRRGGWVAPGQVPVTDELYANYWYAGDGIVLYAFTTKERNYEWNLFPQTRTLGNALGNVSILQGQNFNPYLGGQMALWAAGGAMVIGFGGGGIRCVPDRYRVI